MTLTVRLDDDLQRRLDEHCEKTGASKTEVVKEALDRHLTRDAEGRARIRRLIADTKRFRKKANLGQLDIKSMIEDGRR
jgi:predicted transcriptional regulator